jgi:hypothetical protein
LYCVARMSERDLKLNFMWFLSLRFSFPSKKKKIYEPCPALNSRKTRYTFSRRDWYEGRKRARNNIDFTLILCRMGLGLERMRSHF